MKQFLVYITMGGLMEDPSFHDEHHATITADDEDDAVKQWAKLKGFSDPQYLQKRNERWTYWGWRITIRELK